MTVEPQFEPKFPGYAAKCQAEFAAQAASRLIGATMSTIGPGVCEISLPHDSKLTQQVGYVHGGIISMIADSACGFAALSLMPEEAGVVSVEFKLNFLAPAVGEGYVARARVVKPGRTIFVTQCEIFNRKQGRETLAALMQQTLFVVQPN
jgi:uncharacterized protein (TIGR00369 family)